jgi:short-subunit dehydrogenase
VSSVGGRITTPGTGAYHASKHALEALGDALRFEVRGFGVDVILIESGALRGAHEGVLRLAAGPPEAVARVIERAITAAGPRSRYVVPASSRLFVAFGRWLPDHLWDAVMRRRYHAPGETRRRRRPSSGASGP